MIAPHSRAFKGNGNCRDSSNIVGFGPLLKNGLLKNGLLCHVRAVTENTMIPDRLLGWNLA